MKTSQTRFIHCCNSACNRIFQISKVEVEHGNGIYLCPECFSKSKTHHTIECSNCLSIIDFLVVEKGEEITTYYSQKCTCCTGSVDDEIQLSKFNSLDIYVHS